MSSGVVFVACIPTKEHEKDSNPYLLSNKKQSDKPNVTITQENERRDSETVSLLAEDTDFKPIEPGGDACQQTPEKLTKKGSWNRLKDLASPNSKASEEDGKAKGKKCHVKLDFSPDTSMEEILIQLLKNLKVENYSWQPVKNGNFIQIIFSVEEGPPCEEALRVLTKWGIGVRLKSTLGIIPCAMYFKANETDAIHEDEDKLKGKDKSAWNEFVLSVVRSRLAVAQVVESVKGSAKVTFDFVCLVTLAATIAAVGLVENSTVSIVASMLISPLMGPILAGTFGTVIHDRKLQIMGVRNELFGLSITILVGYIFGLIIGSVDDYYGAEKWPTSEMMSRGYLRSLWVGVLIALPSGAGVALGLLGDNSGSLIGVAISASLLPPAVNAGLLWALATLEGILGRSAHRKENDERFADLVYSDDLPSEYALLGCVSLSLTLVNIVCIFIAGILVLKIKEVAPRALTDDIQQFFRHDIKVARDYNRSVSRDEARQFEKQLAQELAAAFSGDDVENQNPDSANDDVVAFRRRLSSLYHFSPDTLRRISAGPRRLSQTTWSPSISTLENRRRSSVKDLEKLYASLGGSEPPRWSLGGAWKGGPMRTVRDDVSGLTPIMENNMDREENPRRNSFLPRRNQRRYQSHRFTVIPSATDPLQNNKPSK